MFSAVKKLIIPNAREIDESAQRTAVSNASMMI